MRFLATRGDNTPDDRIVEADPKKSWELYQLADAGGNSIIERFKNEGVKGSRILACLDLDINRENAPRGPDDPLADVFGGQWIIYGTANAHPDVPRMVVTGFRSQDLLGFAAGAGAYLLKPFTEEALEAQVRQAAVTRRVKWLCPPKVQDEYNRKLGGKAAFHQYADLLARRLHDESVEVEIIEEVVDSAIAESDLVIVDSCCADDVPAPEALAAIAATRVANPRAPLLLVVPASDVPQDNTTYYFRGIPLALRDGADAVLKKPTWIVGTAHHAPEDALSSAVIKQLNRLNDFDVKYQILVPLIGVVGRFDAAFIERVQAETALGREDIFYAPLLPHLIEIYGLSGRISEVINSEEDMARLKEKLESEPTINPDRWTTAGDGAVPKTLVIEVLPIIRAALLSKAINGHRSFEVWLRKVVEEKARSAYGTIGIHPLTEPLTRVFGGATRYEFGAHGSWYKNIEQRVDDMLIVIEFCAKSSILAKRFIETTVVDYLVKVAGEYCVMVQEIPIRGYLKS
jgi:CheY-like chemotaxis protein